MTEPCPFCNFNDKNVLIYKDQYCFAIISSSPINKYHALVIPRHHYEDFIDIPDEVVSALFLVAKKVSRAIRKTCVPQAITHVSDDDISRAGYNLVAHYKLHIFPRFKKDDNLEIKWPRDPDPGDEVRAASARELKENLES